MLATAVIVFREILEAALIIGIVAAATQGVLHRGLWISSGVIAGLVGAIIVAGLADVIVELADGMGQELFNAIVLLAAAMMLAWHNIWMARHSHELVTRMKQVGTSVKEGGQSMFALLLVVAIAVLREGSEVVLFLYGQSSQGVSLSTMMSGGAAGLAVGASVGVAMYFGLLRIPAKYLFTVTGWMILLLAAGMVSQAVKFLSQADMVPTWGQMWDTSALLADDSVTGRLLHTLIGYDASPMGIQVAVYLLTLIVIGVAMKMVNQKEQVQKKSIMQVALFVLALPVLMSITPAAKAGPASYVYSPNVEYGETEIELSGGYVDDSHQSADGEQQWILGVGRGFTPNWFSEVEFAWSKDPSSATRYQLAEWVNTFQLTERGQNWMDVGLFTEFEFQNSNKSDADTFEFGPMFQKEFGATVNNLNLIFVNQYGSNADHNTALEYAWQTRIKGEPILEYGFQAMGAMGDWNDSPSLNKQEHKIGPAFFGEIKAGGDKVKYNGALLFGATSNTDDYTLRFSVEYEMR